MRLIDADEFKQDIGCVDAVKYGNETEEQQHNSYSTLMMYEIADCIDNAPTIDAVPVARCRECKHWIVNEYWNGNPDQVRACRFAGWMCGANGYCLYGERKMDAEVAGGTK